MANRNYLSSKLYSGHAMMVQVDCNFTVAPADAAGLGITLLKGPYVQNVFMHTSGTPGAGNRNPQTPGIAVTNPNPANGLIVVQLQDNFKSLYDAAVMISSPLSGSALKIDNSELTAGTAVSITVVGSATAAQWQAVGLPKGITPAVGVNFIATAVGAGGNTLTSRVQISAATGSTVMSTELVQSASADLSPSILQQGFGGQLIFQCRDSSGALVAPAVGSAIRIRLFLSNSSVVLQGG